MALARERGRLMNESYVRASRERVMRDAILAKCARLAPQDMYTAIEAWNADKARVRTGRRFIWGRIFRLAHNFCISKRREAR